MARLRAALGEGAFAPPEGAAKAQIELQRSLLANQLDEHQAKLANLDKQVAQNEGNRNAVAATMQKLTVAIPLLRQRAQARKYLADKEVGSRLQYLEVQQDLVEHEQDLLVQRSRLIQADAALAALQQQP